jgi:hypothetical protein
MQRLHEITFCVGATLAGGYVVVSALSLLSLVEVATGSIVQVLAGALAILVPVNLLLSRFNRRRGLGALKLPISPRLFDIAYGALMGLVVLALIYGWIAWRAPRSDVIARQRVEASFFAIWSALVLLGVMALPFYRRNEEPS